MPLETTVENQIELSILQFSSNDGAERQKARWALIEIGSKAIPYLVNCLSSRQLSVRWEAAMALRDLPCPETADALVLALMDETSGVRWLAGEALIACGLPILLPLLHRMQKHFDSVWMLEGAHHVLHGLLLTNKLPAEVLNVFDAISNNSPKEHLVVCVSKALEIFEIPLKLK
jgi:hypothetical protein